MGHAPMAAVLRHIRRLAGPGDDQPPDRQLLERFAAHRDEAAFAALLGRHGPMVLGVCRGILRDGHAAEDAFQATFLILARKAGSIRRHESLAGWLYQVARHVALQARTATARRQDHEKRALVMASAAPWLDLSLRELQETVGEELARLPERYRAPLVLCYLEGKTKDEAARLLGDSPGSVKGRLERGRQQLRARLTKRGLALPAGVFAALLAEGMATARVAGPLAAATVRAALAVAGGQGLIGVSAEVAAIVQGVSQAMALKVKIVSVLVLAAFGVAGAGAFYSAGATWQAPPPTAPAAPAAAQGTKSVPPVAAPKAADQGETLRYAGKVTDKDTGKPIVGATVTVSRRLAGDSTAKAFRPVIIAETNHVTDAEGKYAFTVPPEQTAQENLGIWVVVEHPNYAPFNGVLKRQFWEFLSVVRKDEKLGGRPFFEHVELRPTQAITGTVQTPEGQPAAGVEVMAGSAPSTRTDAQGRFRLSLITPGSAVVRLRSDQYASTSHVLKDNQRGDLGILTLRTGIRLRGQVLDVKGQPLAGVNVNAQPSDRSAVADENGKFEMKPLLPGNYNVHVGQVFNNIVLRPLPAVFVATKVTLTEGAEPVPVEVRATPHVIIEAQFFDSKGQPAGRRPIQVSGLIDKVRWSYDVVGNPALPNADGKLVAYVPHGLENVQLRCLPSMRGDEVLLLRKVKGEPLNNMLLPGQLSFDVISLGKVTDDVKGIEIVQYAAPILLVKVSAKDGQVLKEPAVTAVYSPRKWQLAKGPFGTDERPSDVGFGKQEDGRFRSWKLIPDEEATVTAHAEGYTGKSLPVKLAEGETKEIEIVLEKAPPKDDPKDGKK